MSFQNGVRLHAIISGVVQGVGFRQFTLRQARNRDLTGWVKNRRDRTVEVLAEGPQARLDEFLLILQEGPPAAVVRAVDPTWSKATGEFSTFTIA